jgi:hypothetical protein
MREIKMHPVRPGALHDPDEKHELHIVGSNMTNVVRLTDDELVALRAALAVYRPEVHNGHYGAGCSWHPDGEFHGACAGCAEARAAQNADYGAPGMPPGAPERAREIAETMPTVGQWPGAAQNPAYGAAQCTHPNHPNFPDRCLFPNAPSA